jgi:hypothetical protein
VGKINGKCFAQKATRAPKELAILRLSAIETLKIVRRLDSGM